MTQQYMCPSCKNPTDTLIWELGGDHVATCSDCRGLRMDKCPTCKQDVGGAEKWRGIAFDYAAQLSTIKDAMKGDEWLALQRSIDYAHRVSEEG